MLADKLPIMGYSMNMDAEREGFDNLSSSKPTIRSHSGKDECKRSLTLLPISVMVGKQRKEHLYKQRFPVSQPLVPEEQVR